MLGVKMTTFQMLEKGAASMHVYVLHMLYLLLLRRDAVSSPLVVNAQVGLLALPVTCPTSPPHCRCRTR